MKKLDTALLWTAFGCGVLFLSLIAIDAGLLSDSFRGDGVLFHWQVWLLAAIVVVASRDLLASTRCRVCQEWEVPTLRGVFTMGKILCGSCLERQVLACERSTQ